MAKNSERPDNIPVNLVLENSELVSLLIPENIFIDVFDDLAHAIERGEIFNNQGWSNIEITYKGIKLDRLNCAKVIGLQML